MIRETVKIAAVLTIVLFTGCGDDDAQPDKDGGADSGSPNGSAGKAGPDGGSKGGSGGSKGTGGRSGSGDQVDGGGGAPSSDGGTDASVDAGSGSGGAGSMDAGATAPGCSGLLECCGPLPAMEQMNCELVANNADDATCDEFKPIVCPSASADGGVVADAQACMTLDDCCESLPRGPARVACATTVTNGVALDCQQVLQAFCPSGGDPNACMTLTECCAGLPKPRRKSCSMIVDQGLPAGCETLLKSLCP